MVPETNLIARVSRLLAGARHAAWWRAVLVVMSLVVLWLALTPAPPDTLTLPWDKLNHVAAFASLALATRLGFPGSWGRMVGCGVALLAFGGAIELLQSHVPGRAADVGDLAADVLGIVAGTLLGHTLHWATGGPSGQRGRSS